MTFGFNLFSNTSALVFSTDDITWNQVDFFSVAGYSNTNVSYSVLANKEVLTLQILINAPPTDRKAVAHTITVSGTAINVSGGSESAYILVLMR